MVTPGKKLRDSSWTCIRQLFKINLFQSSLGKPYAKQAVYTKERQTDTFYYAGVNVSLRCAYP